MMTKEDALSFLFGACLGAVFILVFFALAAVMNAWR